MGVTDRHIQDVFLSLLKASLWGVPVRIPSDFTGWKDVARLARSQSVLGLLGEELMSHDIPDELRAKVRTFLMQTVMTHAKMNSVIAEVTAALDKGGVPSVLLKGQGVARFYPKPELRQCGDIDLYVGVEGYARSYEVLKQAGAAMQDAKALKVGKHYNASFGHIEVEVHRYTEVYPFRKYDRIYQRASDAGMTEGLVPMTFGSVSVNTPADTFNAFFIFSHLFHHYLTSGVGLRQFCDWMMILHARRDHIDLAELERLLLDMDLMEPWQAFGCVLVGHLGLSPEEFPFYDSSHTGKSATILSRVLSEGNFGQERDVVSRRRKSYVFNKISSLAGHLSRTSSLLRMFPRQAFRQFCHTFATGLSRFRNGL